MATIDVNENVFRELKEKWQGQLDDIIYNIQTEF